MKLFIILVCMFVTWINVQAQDANPLCIRIQH